MEIISSPEKFKKNTSEEKIMQIEIDPNILLKVN